MAAILTAEATLEFKLASAVLIIAVVWLDQAKAKAKNITSFMKNLIPKKNPKSQA